MGWTVPRCTRGYQVMSHKTPVLASPMKGKPLIPLVGPEERYSLVETTCHWYSPYKNYGTTLTLSTKLISKADLLKHILNRPTLNGWLTKWAVLLSQYDIVCVTQKSIKRQALADILDANPCLMVPHGHCLSNDEVMIIEVQKGWEMYFNGSSRSQQEKKARGYSK